MATLLLSAAGAALGSGFGGTVLGLSGAVVGRAVGATLGRVVDQKLLGAGSEVVDVGRVERFRLMGASEGSAIPQVWGRGRVAGQVIWATRFQEEVRTTGSGKGAPKRTTTEFSYTVSLAVALCAGTITRVGRIWADGVEIAADTLNLRIYAGSDDQLPDPKIEAVEGSGLAPAYRGLAYVVIEDLSVARFGNRVPQFSFEVVRRAQGILADASGDLAGAIKAVALMPGTGEYALASTPVHYADGPGVNRSANVNSAAGKADLPASLDQLRGEVPGCGAISLIVSWFGDDLRCGLCEVRPKVEQSAQDGIGMPWRAGGIGRSAAQTIAREGGRTVYGGTPSDQAVIEAINTIRAGGQQVMFYPFILMEQLAQNGKRDPWTGTEDQPALPWRGRITTSVAPGREGTPDRTAVAADEVAAFFGSAQPAHFAVSNGVIAYSGPDEWRYRRFILHYAHLCALAGGVDSFCIGSEMRGLTQIRAGGDAFPAVAALKQLAAEVRAILGPAVEISYASDWSEYFGYHVGKDVYFHLDPLWSDPNIDFIGIDNYMPVTDWRAGETHADASWGSIYNLNYIKANIAGGEGFDWYYDGPEGELAQRRKPIEDGEHGEPWVYRYKDLRGWWSQPHHDRVNGARSVSPSDWEPQSKPIRFTEYGCAAIDKGTNQPNKFLDPKSSESSLPKFSSGRRDDLIQMQYLRAMAEFWAEPANNPQSSNYTGRMVDMAHAYAWAWDARPFPEFPANTGLWSDGENYAKGHWLNGRVTTQSLASVIAEICEASGLEAFNVGAVFGLVRGYVSAEVGAARQALQPLMLAHGFETVERGGRVEFRMRDGRTLVELCLDGLAISDQIDGICESSRAPSAEMPGRVRLGYTEAEGAFDLRQTEAAFPDETSFGVSQTDLALVLTAAEARGIAERWMAESRIARDSARFALPRSASRLGVGDVVGLSGARYRIDRVEQTETLLVDAVRVEPGVYIPSDAAEERIIARPFAAPVPVYPVFMDLPLLSGAEVPHAPHLAVTATPWPGSVAVWSAMSDDGYELNKLISAPSVIGSTETALAAVRPGLWDRGEPLRVRVFGGTLTSVSELAVLNGANVLAIGDGSLDRWEVLQFASATLVAPGTYDLRLRLRGQAGTDATMPSVWPVGSRVVLLDRGPQQIDLPLSARGLSRHYRIGSAARGYDDPSVTHLIEAFDGIGLRPYPVAHLTARLGAGAEHLVSWVRRTRVDGDSWQSQEVPLGEDSEAYAIRVIRNDAIVREATVREPNWTYSMAQRLVDGPAGAYRVDVAQISDRFGPGPFRGIEMTF